MSNEMKKVLIGEANIHMGDGNYSSKYPKSSDFIETGIPFISAGDFQNGRISSEGFRFISSIQHATLKKGQLKAGDVLVVSRGNSVGQVAFVDKEFENCNINAQLVLLRCDNKEINNLFLYYLLSSNEYQGLMRNYTSGSAQPQFTNRAIKQIPINLPPLPEQKAIAKILGDLDDKIELNRKMNQTLEEMAQALFKSWFVDFDPVLDNVLAAGNEIPEELQILAKKRSLVADDKKLLHTNPELAQLFPDAFVFNEELGKWIPEGWEVKSFGDAATIVGGGTPSTKVQEYYCENGIPWMSPKDLSGYNWKYIGKGASDITELGLQKSSAKLMPKGSVLFSSRAPIGYIAIAENEVCTNQGFKSLVPNKGVPTEYLFQFLKANANEIEAVATGSTFKEVSGSALKGISILIPAKNIIEEFTMKLEASNKRSLIIQKQTETLVKLRDTLLPQLISGKLRVPEVMLNVVEKIN